MFPDSAGAQGKDLYMDYAGQLQVTVKAVTTALLAGIHIAFSPRANE